MNVAKNLTDSPMAMLQLLKDLELSGFNATFSLQNGLEITIRKRKGPPREESDSLDRDLCLEHD